jgi:hypothetical protein
VVVEVTNELEDWARTAPLTELRDAVVETRGRTADQSSPQDEADLRALEPILAEREEKAYSDWLTGATRQELVQAREEARTELEHGSSPASERLAYDASLRIRVIDDVGFIKAADGNHGTISAWLEDRLDRHSMPRDELHALADELHRTATDTFSDELANWFSHRVESNDERVDRLPEELHDASRDELEAREQMLSERLSAGLYVGQADDRAALDAVRHEQHKRDNAEVDKWAATYTTPQLVSELQTLQDKAEFGQATAAEQNRLSRGSEILDDRRLEAITAWVDGMSTDALRATIADLKGDAAQHADPWAEQKLFWAESALWGREHGDKGLDTVVIDPNGRVGTIRDFATEAERAYVQGGLDALTGNFVAALTFTLSDDPHLAAMLGGFFDAFGGVAQGRAEFRQVQPPATGDPIQPTSHAAPAGSTAPAETPGAGAVGPASSPPVDWSALRERVDVPQPRQSDRGFRMQEAREGDYGVIRIEGPIGDPIPKSETSAAKYATRLEGEHATHGVGRQLGENVGPSGMGSAPPTFNLSQMKVYENMLREVADAAEPFGAVVETVTYLRVEHRVVNGEDVPVILGVDREATLRLPGSDRLYDIGRLVGEIDPTTRQIHPIDGGASPPPGGAVSPPGGQPAAAPGSAAQEPSSPWMATLREFAQPWLPTRESTHATPSAPSAAPGPAPPPDGKAGAANEQRGEAEGPDPGTGERGAEDSDDSAVAVPFDMEADAAAKEQELQPDQFDQSVPTPLLEPETHSAPPTTGASTTDAHDAGAAVVTGATQTSQTDAGQAPPSDAHAGTDQTAGAVAASASPADDSSASDTQQPAAAAADSDGDGADNQDAASGGAEQLAAVPPDGEGEGGASEQLAGEQPEAQDDDAAALAMESPEPLAAEPVDEAPVQVDYEQVQPQQLAGGSV